MLNRRKKAQQNTGQLSSALGSQLALMIPCPIHQVSERLVDKLQIGREVQGSSNTVQGEIF